MTPDLPFELNQGIIGADEPDPTEALDGVQLLENLQRGRWHIVKRTIQSTVVALELAPTNEAIRFGSFAAAQAINGDPLVGGAVLGLSTLVVEGSAAIATASLITSEGGNKVIEGVNKRLNRFISPEAKMTPLLEAGVAMVGGSAIVMAVKQRENPERTTEQARRHGLFTAGWMSSYFAVEGALISEGINHPNVKTIGAALLVAAGVHTSAKIVQKRNTTKKLSGEK